MKRFIPERPHGVLFDGNGDVVYRFANFTPGTTYPVPEYVDETADVQYVDSKKPGDAYPMDAHPLASDLPDPEPPGLTADSAVPEFARGNR